MKVWMSGWEYECCGEPFALGSEVEWWLLPISPEDREFYGGPLGADVADGLTQKVAHHGVALADPVKPVSTRGRVASIDAVYWAVSSLGYGVMSFYPVPGSAVLRSVGTSDDPEPEAVGNLDLEGYIVELTPLEGRSQPL